MNWYMIIFRLLHIVIGAVWVGTGVFVAFFLEPVVSGLGPDGGKVMNALQTTRKLSEAEMLAGITTVVAGAALYWRVSAHFNSDWVKSSTGKTLSL